MSFFFKVVDTKKDVVLALKKENVTKKDEGNHTNATAKINDKNKVVIKIPQQKTALEKKTNSKMSTVIEKEKDDQFICGEYSEEIYQYLIEQQV